MSKTEQPVCIKGAELEALIAEIIGVGSVEIIETKSASSGYAYVVPKELQRGSSTVQLPKGALKRNRLARKLSYSDIAQFLGTTDRFTRLAVGNWEHYDQVFIRHWPAIAELYAFPESMGMGRNDDQVLDAMSVESTVQKTLKTSILSFAAGGNGKGVMLYLDSRDSWDNFIIDRGNSRVSLIDPHEKAFIRLPKGLLSNALKTSGSDYKSLAKAMNMPEDVMRILLGHWCLYDKVMAVLWPKVAKEIGLSEELGYCAAPNVEFV